MFSGCDSITQLAHFSRKAQKTERQIEIVLKVITIIPALFVYRDIYVHIICSKLFQNTIQPNKYTMTIYDEGAFFLNSATETNKRYFRLA